jgi:hypothetical protein
MCVELETEDRNIFSFQNDVVKKENKEKKQWPKSKMTLLVMATIYTYNRHFMWNLTIHGEGVECDGFQSAAVAE